MISNTSNKRAKSEKKSNDIDTDNKKETKKTATEKETKKQPTEKQPKKESNKKERLVSFVIILNQSL